MVTLAPVVVVAGVLLAGFQLAKLFSKTTAGYIVMGILFSGCLFVVYVGVVFVGCAIAMQGQHF